MVKKWALVSLLAVGVKQEDGGKVCRAADHMAHLRGDPTGRYKVYLWCRVCKKVPGLLYPPIEKAQCMMDGVIVP